MDVVKEERLIFKDKFLMPVVTGFVAFFVASFFLDSSSLERTVVICILLNLLLMYMAFRWLHLAQHKRKVELEKEVNERLKILETAIVSRLANLEYLLDDREK